MKLWTLATPSRERLQADWFLRTLPTDCHPVVNRIDAEPAEYGRGQWRRVVASQNLVRANSLMVSSAWR